MRISDWSSDVCSSDLVGCGGGILAESMARAGAQVTGIDLAEKSLKVAKLHGLESGVPVDDQTISAEDMASRQPSHYDVVTCMVMHIGRAPSELQSLMRISYAVFCLKKKTNSYCTTTQRN